MLQRIETSLNFSPPADASGSPARFQIADGLRVLFVDHSMIYNTVKIFVRRIQPDVCFFPYPTAEEALIEIARAYKANNGEHPFDRALVASKFKFPSRRDTSIEDGLSVIDDLIERGMQKDKIALFTSLPWLESEAKKREISYVVKDDKMDNYLRFLSGPK